MAAAEHGRPEVTGCKTFDTLRARLALRGFTLQPAARGGFMVAQWGRWLVVADLAAVEAFAVRAGCPS